MILLDWLRQWHEIKREKLRFERENTICESCETLKHELEVVRLENQRLIDRILEKPAEPAPVSTEGLKPITPKFQPWKVRQQMLENEDRIRAKRMKEYEIARNDSAPSGGQVFKTAADVEHPMTTEQLEKELGVEENAG